MCDHVNNPLCHSVVADQVFLIELELEFGGLVIIFQKMPNIVIMSAMLGVSLVNPKPTPQMAKLKASLPYVITIFKTQATSNQVPWEEHGTYPLNLMGHNVIDGKFVCSMIEGNYYGKNQSEMTMNNVSL